MMQMKYTIDNDAIFLYKVYNHVENFQADICISGCKQISPLFGSYQH